MISGCINEEREISLTVVWHHLQCLPSNIFTLFLHLWHRAVQLPSTQWCTIFWLDRRLFAYVLTQLLGAFCTHRSCTVYLHTANIAIHQRSVSKHARFCPFAAPSLLFSVLDQSTLLSPSQRQLSSAEKTNSTTTYSL